MYQPRFVEQMPSRLFGSIVLTLLSACSSTTPSEPPNPAKPPAAESHFCPANAEAIQELYPGVSYLTDR